MRSAAIVCLCLVAAPAAAQEQIFGEAHFVGDAALEVVTRFRPARGAVEVRLGEQRVAVHEGAPRHAWAAGGDAGVLVVLLGVPLEAVFVPVEAGRLGAPRRAPIARPAGPDRAPVGAAVALTPQGFSVFWQEASTTSPTALYETYLAAFDRLGAPAGAPVRVHAQWPLAAVAWQPDRGQFFFLLYYGGGDPRGTRLCGVHVDPAQLRNVEHPFWSSRPGMIDEARLVVRDRRVVAVYRDDGRLFERDVTEGAWGTDPPEARSHGPIAPSEAYGMRASASGVTIRRARLAP
ncbi:MAG: hypothetical protein KF729_07730 [Sandaracinaceae bacterium]|nr:hypothetical protein [Sandaracinaceae bacterium]